LTAPGPTMTDMLDVLVLGLLVLIVLLTAWFVRLCEKLEIGQ